VIDLKSTVYVADQIFLVV